MNIKDALLMPSNRGLFRYLLAVIAGFLLLCSLQINSSSLGILSSSGLESTDIILGHPRAIRSDEYLRTSPSLIGSLTHAYSLNTITPLSVEGSEKSQRAQQSIIGRVRNLVSDSPFQFLHRLVPIGVAFAMDWWFNTLLLFLVLPVLFQLMRLKWGYGVATCFLIWFNPITQWWSLWPLRMISTGLLGITLALLYARWADSHIFSKRSSRLQTVLTGIVVGLVLSRLLFFYQPWSIPASIALGCFGIALFLQEPISNWMKVQFLCATFSSLVLVMAVNLAADSVQLGVAAATDYPGQRRSEGGLAFPRWSGGLDWVLQRRGQVINQSEIALGLLVLLIFALATPLILKAIGQSPSVSRPLLLGISGSSFFLLWATAPFPIDVWILDGFKFIPPVRGLQIVSLVGALFFGIAIATWRNNLISLKKSRPIFLGLMSICFLLVLKDSVDLRNQYFPAVGMWAVWLTTLAVILFVGLPFIVNGSPVLLLAPLLIFSGLGTMFVNPVMRGVGVFQDSDFVAAVVEASKVDNGRWATDGLNNDSVILAAGVPQLSGQSGSGPNRDAWQKIDPGELDSQKWNRGSAYITFSWSQDSIQTISNPSPDVILVTINPCSNSLGQLGLSWVVSSQSLQNECLKMFATVNFLGAPVNIYRLRAT